MEGALSIFVTYREPDQAQPHPDDVLDVTNLPRDEKGRTLQAQKALNNMAFYLRLAKDRLPVNQREAVKDYSRQANDLFRQKQFEDLINLCRDVVVVCRAC